MSDKPSKQAIELAEILCERRVNPFDKTKSAITIQHYLNSYHDEQSAEKDARIKELEEQSNAREEDSKMIEHILDDEPGWQEAIKTIPNCPTMQSAAIVRTHLTAVLSREKLLKTQWDEEAKRDAELIVSLKGREKELRDAIKNTVKIIRVHMSDPAFISLSAIANLLEKELNPPSPRPTRYDWSKAPEWAMWAATDEDGEVFFYRNKPEIYSEDQHVWAYNWPDDAKWLSHVQIGHHDKPCPDWRDSLEQRPVETDLSGGVEADTQVAGQPDAKQHVNPASAASSESSASPTQSPSPSQSASPDPGDRRVMVSIELGQDTRTFSGFYPKPIGIFVDNKCVYSLGYEGPSSSRISTPAPDVMGVGPTLDDLRRSANLAPVAKEEKCETCKGEQSTYPIFGPVSVIPCPTCNGTGNRPREQYNSHCPSCHAYNSGENTKCQQCGILRMTWTEHLNKQREEVKMKDRCLCAYEYHQDRGTVRHRHANCPVHQAALATEQSESPAVGARECWGVPGKFGMRNYYPSKDVAEQYQDGIRPIVRFIEHTAYQAKVDECERLRAILKECEREMGWAMEELTIREDGWPFSTAILFAFRRIEKALKALKGVKA